MVKLKDREGYKRKQLDFAGINEAIKVVRTSKV
jgi:hypothetical protein